MDYLAMANELLDVRAKLLQVPAAQLLVKMERGELFVLNYLVTHDGAIHPKELSIALAVSTARIATILNKLEEKKLVQRHIDQEDNRQVIIALTEKGRQEILHVRSNVLPQISNLLESLGPEDASAFILSQKKVWQIHQDKCTSK